MEEKYNAYETKASQVIEREKNMQQLQRTIREKKLGQDKKKEKQ